GGAAVDAKRSGPGKPVVVRTLEHDVVHAVGPGATVGPGDVDLARTLVDGRGLDPVARPLLPGRIDVVHGDARGGQESERSAGGQRPGRGRRRDHELAHAGDGLGQIVGRCRVERRNDGHFRLEHDGQAAVVPDERDGAYTLARI